MIKYLVNKTILFGALLGIICSVGSIGVYMNWNDPAWHTIGVYPEQLKSSISAFPDAHCKNELHGMCAKVSQGVLWFLGFSATKPT